MALDKKMSSTPHVDTIGQVVGYHLQVSQLGTYVQENKSKFSKVEACDEVKAELDRIKRLRPVSTLYASVPSPKKAFITQTLLASDQQIEKLSTKIEKYRKRLDPSASPSTGSTPAFSSRIAQVDPSNIALTKKALAKAKRMEEKKNLAIIRVRTRFEGICRGFEQQVEEVKSGLPVEKESPSAISCTVFENYLSLYRKKKKEQKAYVPTLEELSLIETLARQVNENQFRRSNIIASTKEHENAVDNMQGQLESMLTEDEYNDFDSVSRLFSSPAPPNPTPLEALLMRGVKTCENFCLLLVVNVAANEPLTEDDVDLLNQLVKATIESQKPTNKNGDDLEKD